MFAAQLQQCEKREKWLKKCVFFFVKLSSVHFLGEQRSPRILGGPRVLI